MTRSTRWQGHGLWLILGATACGDGVSPASDAADVVTADTAPDTAPPEVDAAPDALTGGAGLGVDYGARPGGPMVRHDPGVAGFTATPWPSDRDRGLDGAPDLSRFPNPNGVEMLDSFKSYGASALDGFGLNSAVYFELDRGIDPASLPTAEASLTDAGSAVQWIALSLGAEDYGQRRPVSARMVDDASDPYYQGPTLAIHPVYGFPLRDGGTYCVLLTRGLTDAAGRHLQPDPDFLADLASDPSFAPLRVWLPGSPLGLDDLATATCFTAQDATRELFEVSNELERLEPVYLTQVTANGQTTHHTAISAVYRSPNFQAGQKPYSSEGGDLRFDADGRPVVQAWENLRALILVPKGPPMPADGWPVILYGHGTGGDWRSCLGSEAEAVREGYVMICIDQPLHGTRGTGGEVNVLDVFNFVNPASGRTSFRQSAIDVMWQARLVAEGRFDFAATPANGNVALRLDRDHISFFGHSHGGLAGAIALGVDRRMRGAMLSGSSGVLIETLLRRKDPVDIESLVAAVTGVTAEQLDTFHPVVNLAQMLVDASDPVNYAPYWRSPRGGGRPRDVLMTSGSEDEASPAVGADAVAAAAGVPLIEPTDHPSPGHALRGLVPQALPLVGNVVAPASASGALTAGLRQYPGGDHFVALELRAAITLWRSFFRSYHPANGDTAAIGE